MAEITETVSTETAKTKKTNAGGYRFLAILFAILAVGGLFIGLLAKVAQSVGFLSFFKVAELYQSNEILPNSIIGLAISMIKRITEIFNMGVDSYAEMAVMYAKLIFVFLALVAAVVSILMVLFSFLSEGSAKRCAMFSGIFTLIAYGGLFLLNFGYYPTTTFTAALFDMPSAVIAGLTALILVITAIARSKGRGFLYVLVTIFTAGIFLAVTYPGSQIATYIRMTTTEGIENGIFKGYALVDYILGENKELFVGIAMTALVALIALNLLISVIRMNGKKAFFFDVFRYGLQFIAVAVAIVAIIVTADGNKFAIFTDSKNMLPTILLIALAIVTLLIVILIAIRSSVAKSAVISEEESAQPEETQEVYAEEEVEVEDESEEDEEYEAEYEDANEEEEERLINQQIEDAARTKLRYAAQQPAYPVNPYPAYPTPYPGYPTPVYVTNAPTPAPAPAPAVEKSEPVQMEIEKTEFEKRMEAIARGENAPAAKPAPAPAPAEEPERRPVYNPQAPVYVSAPMRQNGSQPVVYDASSFTYDPFMNNLTSQEKAEFGDLFISNKYGMHAYLPPYVMGENNDEFFNKVFIYLGRFRAYISTSLLEKLNNYISTRRMS